MESLRDELKFNLEQGQLVVAQVAAFNDKGQGNFSGTNIIGALVEVLPSAPIYAPTRGELTDQTKIDVRWEFLIGEAQTGGSEIISYELQTDDGLGGDFEEVVGRSSVYTLNSRVITSNIDSGRTYRFRYRAKNIHGWGEFSPIEYILAATVPSAPTG